MDIGIEQFCPNCQEKAASLFAENAALKPKPRRKRLPNPEKENWIPLRDIFGTAKIPEGAAEIVVNAITKMLTAGDIEQSNKWQFLEYLSAEYMASGE
jgi:hypothetical protein